MSRYLALQLAQRPPVARPRGGRQANLACAMPAVQANAGSVHRCLGHAEARPAKARHPQGRDHDISVPAGYGRSQLNASPNGYRQSDIECVSNVRPEWNIPA